MPGERVSAITGAVVRLSRAIERRLMAETGVPDRIAGDGYAFSINREGDSRGRGATGRQHCAVEDACRKRIAHADGRPREAEILLSRRRQVNDEARAKAGTHTVHRETRDVLDAHDRNNRHAMRESDGSVCLASLNREEPGLVIAHGQLPVHRHIAQETSIPEHRERPMHRQVLNVLERQRRSAPGIRQGAEE